MFFVMRAAALLAVADS